MKPILLTLLISVISVHTNAQDWKRTMNWYFGDSAGLSFATDPPTVLTDGAMNALEGCATISDTNGNLLFYTNGITVWNKNHQVMENGTDLYGNLTSTQSALIVPWPESDNLYYIFTTDAVGQWKGLRYSLVNMNENGGLGKVTVKNVLLHTPVCEKLTATHHQNGKDIWVMVHEFNSDKFLPYLVTTEGITSCPVETKIGSFHGSLITDAQGMMKFSPSGEIMAIVCYQKNWVELYSFDKEFGKIEGTITISGFLRTYGIEFSENEKYLYITSRDNNLVQADISSKDPDIINSEKESIYYGVYASPLQIGSNGKIYLTHGDSSFLSVIHSPDSKGDSSGFSYAALTLPDRKSQYGLPNFVSSYFYRPALDYTYKTSCNNDSVYFEAKSSGALASPSWNIFKNTDLIHSSNQSATWFHFPDTGHYQVQLISGADTVNKAVYIESKLDLGSDTVICGTTPVLKALSGNLRCISWQDGSDSSGYTIAQSGSYHVSAYNIKGCLVSDTVKVLFKELDKPALFLKGDTLYTDSGSYTYKWFFNGGLISGDKYFIKVTQNGNYRVEITDSNGCSAVSADFPVTGLVVKILKAEDHFLVYPVPAFDQLFIESKNQITVKNIVLTDITGRKFHYSPAREISLKGLAKGIYFIEITDEQHNTYTTKAIIH
jgi:hypothetical protein